MSSEITPPTSAFERYAASSAEAYERYFVPHIGAPVAHRLLESAGVREGRVVIAGDPISAGRAYAAFDYLGLGDDATLLDGGPTALLSDGSKSSATTTASAQSGANASTSDDAGSLDIDVRDAIGRSWQLSTIQCDFNHPERFELEFTGPWPPYHFSDIDDG